MSYETFITTCMRMRTRNPAWRKGQTYYNVLSQVRPDLCERIRTSKLDPFYMDERIPAFLEWVKANW